MKTLLQVLFITSSVLFFFSCNEAKQEQSVTEDHKTDSTVTEQRITDVKANMEMFSNIEMVEYCLPLPLKEYVESNNGVKAKHTFAHKTKKDNVMAVQGLLREDPSVSFEDYYLSSCKNAKSEGRVLQEIGFLEEKDFFYMKGYWENSLNVSRFAEICWLRKDEVVTFYSKYDIADTSNWNGYLNEMIAAGPECK